MPFTPSSIATKPLAWLLIQDPLVAGGDDVARATSESGPQVGITEPDENNVGGMLPSVIPDPAPDADTQIDTTLQLVQGGGAGLAEWGYLPALADDTTRTEEWRGYNSELYEWGHHCPFTQTHRGVILLYSSLYRRVLAIGVDTGGDVNVKSSDANDRPTTADDWSNLAAITPEDGGASTYKHALAGCELRDGTLLLAVRKRFLDSTGPDILSRGDWNLYRSIDGGETWTLALRDLFSRMGLAGTDPDDEVMVRMLASGSWVRLIYSSNGGSLGTLVSSNDGVTWTALETIDTITMKTDQTVDQVTYDFVGLDDQTGTFLFVGGDTASANVKFYTATRDENWTAITLVSVTGQPTTRSLYFVRDPYWLTLYARFQSQGNPSNRWAVYRVKRDEALVVGSWKTLDDYTDIKGADRLCPVQASAVWCGDRAAVSYHLLDTGMSSPYDLEAARPVLHWIGGWTIRPFGNDYERFDNRAELLRWTYDHGQPAGGITSATQSGWVQTLTSGGTSSWNVEYLRVETYGASDAAYHSYTWTDPTDSDAPPQWDCPTGEEALWRRTKAFEWEWVVAADDVAPVGTSASYIATRITIPSAQLSPAAWRIAIRHTTSGLVLYNSYSATPLATLSVDLTTGDDQRYHRVRFCVSPAASPANPTGVLMHRREDGDLWTETTQVDLGQPNGAAGVTQTTVQFGHLAHTGADTMTSFWREMRIAARHVRTDYAALAGWTAPDDLPGARVAPRPRSLGSGATTSDSNRLAVAWGGGGAALGDGFVHSLSHAGAAELAAGIPSPSFGWTSAAGATAASTYLAFDAGAGVRSRNFESPEDTGSRFVHSHCAIYGLHGPSGRVEYSDNMDFSSAVVAATYNSLYLTGVTSANVAGYRVGLSAAGLTTVGRASLVGHLLVGTSGTGVVGKVWKIRRHEYDPDFAVHYVDLDPSGQFTSTSLAAGQTFAIGSDRVWLDYGQTIRRRYMKVTGGLATTNNWDGKWGASQVVPGLAWQIHPPLDWSHTDEERANTRTFRTRAGAEWSREEGSAARVLTGRLIGDDREALYELRDLLRSVAKYHVRPMALLRDDERTKGQDRSLWLVTWLGDSVIDGQAYARDLADVIRRFGDQQVSFRELV